MRKYVHRKLHNQILGIFFSFTFRFFSTSNHHRKNVEYYNKRQNDTQTKKQHPMYKNLKKNIFMIKM